ncbi:UPF0223 family protein [Apilactobacillus zhangqiuensis]|uniref:UPF0223 family protein n=1 Tax=Apilactobacillus zhangqiuensis TaxID=2841031 RepID=UPI001C7D159B|nr:UPF0223 family protein [Apilactobacillus zhangqiuensis]
MNNYSYPIFPDWTKDELMDMMALYNAVESAYEDANGVNAEKVVNLYNRFREINPAKMEQKQIDRDFESISGYSLYKAFQAATKANTKNIRM